MLKVKQGLLKRHDRVQGLGKPCLTFSEPNTPRPWIQAMHALYKKEFQNPCPINLFWHCDHIQVTSCNQTQQYCCLRFYFMTKRILKIAMGTLIVLVDIFTLWVFCQAQKEKNCFMTCRQMFSWSKGLPDNQLLIIYMGSVELLLEYM